jgi:hypothetical protein
MSQITKNYQCRYCGKTCKSGPGKFAHERYCAKQPKQDETEPKSKPGPKRKPRVCYCPFCGGNIEGFLNCS